MQEILQISLLYGEFNVAIQQARQCFDKKTFLNSLEQLLKVTLAAQTELLAQGALVQAIDMYKQIHQLCADIQKIYIMRCLDIHQQLQANTIHSPSQTIMQLSGIINVIDYMLMLLITINDDLPKKHSFFQKLKKFNNIQLNHLKRNKDMVVSVINNVMAYLSNVAAYLNNVRDNSNHITLMMQAIYTHMERALYTQQQGTRSSTNLLSPSLPTSSPLDQKEDKKSTDDLISRLAAKRLVAEHLLEPLAQTSASNLIDTTSPSSTTALNPSVTFSSPSQSRLSQRKKRKMATYSSSSSSFASTGFFSTSSSSSSSSSSAASHPGTASEIASSLAQLFRSTQPASIKQSTMPEPMAPSSTIESDSSTDQEPHFQLICSP